MKPWMKWVLVLVVIIVVGMILAPRVWVKNKVVTLTLDGRKSPNVKLYHGTGGQLLVELSDPADTHTYLFSDGIHQCSERGYRAMKLLAIGRPSECVSTGEAWPQAYSGQFSAEFKNLSGNRIKISWQPPPG